VAAAHPGQKTLKLMGARAEPKSRSSVAFKAVEGATEQLPPSTTGLASDQARRRGRVVSRLTKQTTRSGDTRPRFFELESLSCRNVNTPIWPSLGFS
jgi:hypothetical protein